MKAKELRRERERYVNRYLRGRQFAVMHVLRVFPNAKEITESFGAFAAVQEHCGFDQGDPDVALVAVGDGRTPRTALTFAIQSRWQCHSVDPCGPRKPRHQHRNLTTHRMRVEDMPLVVADRVVIVAVHSHALLAEAVERVRAKELCIVSIPCCVPQVLPSAPDLAYRDPAIWSPENEVLVWKRYRTEVPF